MEQSISRSRQNTSLSLPSRPRVKVEQSEDIICLLNNLVTTTSKNQQHLAVQAVFEKMREGTLPKLSASELEEVHRLASTAAAKIDFQEKQKAKSIMSMSNDIEGVTLNFASEGLRQIAGQACKLMIEKSR